MKEKKFIEHLDELRSCLLNALLGLGVATVVSFIFISKVFKLISRPYTDFLATVGEKAIAFRSLAPADTLQVTLKAAIMSGLCLSFPWIAYQTWKFVGPALYRHEKRYTLIFCFSVAAFFLAGVAFCYLAVLPMTLAFFYKYTMSLGVVPEWTIGNYYGFVISFLICFGLVFELPVAVVILSWLGIVTPETFAQYRRHVIVVIFIVAAIFTPSPDFVSQLMMGVPMVVLYEISILASRFVKPSPKGLYCDTTRK